MVFQCLFRVQIQVPMDWTHKQLVISGISPHPWQLNFESPLCRKTPTSSSKKSMTVGISRFHELQVCWQKSNLQSPQTWWAQLIICLRYQRPHNSLNGFGPRRHRPLRLRCQCHCLWTTPWHRAARVRGGWQLLSPGGQGMVAQKDQHQMEKTTSNNGALAAMWERIFLLLVVSKIVTHGSFSVRTLDDACVSWICMCGMDAS